MRRVVVAMNVPDGTETHDLATELALRFDGSDPTVWKWHEFWSDVRDGMVGEDGDKTRIDADHTGQQCWLEPIGFGDGTYGPYVDEIDASDASVGVISDETHKIVWRPIDWRPAKTAQGD